ncbi:hypothetical protein BT96DRAFT_981688 [Gymnopus androsaceus JB14]|uniref:Uncharacterized protein n=1 Tax=Gymnopus androsaceus JB14 TaxID=1447944 RepID=A0A6A4GMT2_9AGAR|nr:hypothetical protein BT96DRAFT_981688 [Gymnopus androsaceus JB14]
MGTPVTAATQTAPILPAPPATHTLLPTTWVIPSGGTGLFPKAEHQMLKGEENYAPWSNIFLTAVKTIGCKQILSGVIPCPDPVLHPTEYGVWSVMDSYFQNMLSQCIQYSMLGMIQDPNYHAAFNRLAATFGPKGSALLMTFFLCLNCHLAFSHDFASLSKHCQDFETSLQNMRQSGYMVDKGFASAILVTTLSNNPNTPGSWHTWISNFSLTSATTVALTVAQILGSYCSAHPDKSGDSGMSNVDSAITTVEHALLAKGKYFC